MIKLNLGSGEFPLEDYINVDLYSKADIHHDLNKFPYPFKDNYADEILITHTLEHLNDVIKAMEEIYRISKNKAIIKITVPYFSHVGAFRDVTHKHFFSYHSLDMFDITKREHYGFNSFIIKKRRIRFGKFFRLIGIRALANKFPNFYENYLAYICPARELCFELVVYKNQDELK